MRLTEPDPGRDETDKPAAAAAKHGEAAAATPETCYAAGRRALESCEIEEARGWAERAEAAPAGPAQAYGAALRGAIAIETGNLDQAVAYLRRAAEGAPRDASIARSLAEVLSLRGQAAEAAAVLEAAARDSADPSLLVDLGYARMTSGDRKAARKALDRAASLGAGNAETARSLSRMYEALGETELAIGVLAPLAARRPAPLALSDLARLYLAARRYGEAEGVFESLKSADPEHELFARQGQAWCRIKRGDWRGALETALDATRLDRLDFTTALLAYAKDRLFTRVLDAGQREAELEERFMAELSAHAELHFGEQVASEAGAAGSNHGDD